MTDEERAERYVEIRRFPQEEKNRIYWFERVIEAGEKKLKEMEEGIEKARLRRYLSIGHQNKAIEEHRNGLIRSQMETLDRLINNYPESAVVMWAKLQVNWCHMALGQYSMAVKGYREFIDTHPQAARNRRENAYFWSAYAQYHSGEKGAAAEAFKKYLHLFDNGIFDEWAKYWAARTFAELGDSSEAMAYFEQLKNDYPDTVFDISAIIEE